MEFSSFFVLIIHFVLGGEVLAAIENRPVALLLADSFDQKFSPITLESPRVKKIITQVSFQN